MNLNYSDDISTMTAFILVSCIILFFSFLVIEYGVLNSYGCGIIFPLELNDLDDLNYLNTDGKLYIFNKEPLNPENYCIENALSSNNSSEVNSLFISTI